MAFDFEYAVVGGGGMGSAAAYYIAREQKSVLLLEQFEIGHNRGASHGESRIIRYSYEWTDYVKLAKDAFQLWHEVETEFGAPLLHRTGGLDIGYPGNIEFDQCIECLTEENIDFELLSPAEATTKFPQFNIDKNTRCVYQADAGYLEPDACVPAMVSLARKHGAVVKDATTVDDTAITDDGIKIFANGEKWQVKNLILAPGPWASPLLERLTGVKIPIKVTMEQYAFFKPKHSELFDEKKSPVFIVYVSPGELKWLYGFPYYKELGVKVAEHRAGAVTDAQSRSFEPDPEKLKRLVSRAQNLIPDLTSEITKAATCLYSNTPDEHFVIDKLPGRDNVVIAAGFSGHGFKFVPVVGSIIKDLALSGHTRRPIERFKIKRFEN